MGTPAGSDRSIAREDAVEQTVGDVMIKRPKTLPADALISEVRAAFERSTVRTVLLADGDRFAGAIGRDGLLDNVADTEPAAAFIELGPATVTPTTPMSVAVELLARRG